MPNRILKESICWSPTIAELTAEEERFFVRLIVKCDDFGLYDARPVFLRSQVFPLWTDLISLEQIGQWLDALVDVGLVQLYEVKGRPYLQVVNWLRHQQRRADKPKYPLPDEGALIRPNASNGYQVPAEENNGLPLRSYPGPETRTRTRIENVHGAHEVAPAVAAHAASTSESKAMWECLLAGGCAPPLTRSEKGGWGKAIKELLDAGQTPATVATALVEYRDRWPDMECTPLAIANNLGRLKGKRPARRANGQKSTDAARYRYQDPGPVAAAVPEPEPTPAELAAIQARNEADRAKREHLRRMRSESSYADDFNHRMKTHHWEGWRGWRPPVEVER